MSRENQTVARSFRVSTKALRVLEEEARKQNTSVNTLGNQILLDFSEFGRFARRFNAMRISRGMLSDLIISIPEDAIVTAARRLGQSWPAAYMTSKWGEVNPVTAMGLIRDLSAYANWFEYYEAKENDKRALTLVHELGSKWSLFLSQYFGEVFALCDIHPKTRTSEGAVTFMFQ